MRVECEVRHVDLEGDFALVDGVCVSCLRCRHEVEVFGGSEASIRRGLVMLREQCPRGEENFYVNADD